MRVTALHCTVPRIDRQTRRHHVPSIDSCLGHIVHLLYLICLAHFLPFETSGTSPEYGISGKPFTCGASGTSRGDVRGIGDTTVTRSMRTAHSRPIAVHSGTLAGSKWALRWDAGKVLDRVLAKLGGRNWWTTLAGRARVQTMFSAFRNDNAKVVRLP